MKLTKNMIAALRRLDKDGALGTSTAGMALNGPYIPGTTASALIRRGLAKRQPRYWDDCAIPDSFQVGITNEGRQWLRQHGGRS